MKMALSIYSIIHMSLMVILACLLFHTFDMLHTSQGPGAQMVQFCMASLLATMVLDDVAMEMIRFDRGVFRGHKLPFKGKEMD
jgi:hypothetical protein